MTAWIRIQFRRGLDEFVRQVKILIHDFPGLMREKRICQKIFDKRKRKKKAEQYAFQKEILKAGMKLVMKNFGKDKIDTEWYCSGQRNCKNQFKV